MAQFKPRESAEVDWALSITLRGPAMCPISSPQEDQPLPPKRPPVREFPEPLLDSEQAAAIIGIHPKTLQRYARQRLIRGIHIGKLWRFRASTIEEWIRRELAS
jgi:excisionase family DNA binding protein